MARHAQPSLAARMLAGPSEQRRMDNTGGPGVIAGHRLRGDISTLFEVSAGVEGCAALHTDFTD